jgi:aspartyl-tRNA(Asn)/glutamyl-tRNA(Gln) amidotransferase subunit C
MPEITPETVRRIARLANLALTEDETGRFASQLEKILEYVHKLNELDTRGVPETAHALPLQNVWREDRVTPGLEREAALSGAPDPQDGCFRVPRIIE